MKIRIAVLFVALGLLYACNQNMEETSTRETLQDAPRPAADPNARPFAAAGGGDGDKMKVPPFVKAYFMHMWVEALYSTPQNNTPNPNWQSPLKDPENVRVWCT